MSEDRIYASDPGTTSFQFNEAVAAVFPDMLKRSIPGYEASILAIGSLASQFVKEDTCCYDLGCSLGAATLAMRQNIAGRDARIVAIDNSAAMIDRCRKIVEGDESPVPVEIISADVRDASIENASMVVMNYTLQFLPIADRDEMIAGIFAGLNNGGLFILSEKVADEDGTIENILVDLHHEQKRRNAYSESEISRKRAAIENVLIPESLVSHRTRLSNAGFRHIGVWLRIYNFVSMIAIK